MIATFITFVEFGFMANSILILFILRIIQNMVQKALIMYEPNTRI